VPIVERDSKAILTNQEKRIGDNLQELEAMKRLAREAMNGLKKRRFDVLGPILDTAWMLKKSLSPRISSPIIDEMYEAGYQAGSTGGKVCGAGGGGYMLFYCPTGTHEAVREAMVPYGPELKFNFEWEGSVCQTAF
jgi:D-glycero-alpha-D-manno-heptose-7-phosphate kinase